MASTRSSLTISWTAPTLAADDLPILGYVLNIDDGVTQDLLPVYIGMYRPEILEYAVGDLQIGLPYLFSVQAINQNGYSAHSALATYYPCVNPVSIAPPTYVSSSRAAMTISIEWRKPPDNGGCAVLGYRLFRDDGSVDQFSGDALDTPIAGMSSVDPSITQYTIDLSGVGTVGYIYKFKVLVHNQAGETESSALSVALASLPSTPTTAPQTIPAFTGPAALGLEIALLTSDAEDGGSPILQYEVQYDDGARGAYRGVYTLSPEVVVTFGIQRGREYRTRYRAMNFNGWGEYSPVGYIEAAGLPQKPPAPVLLASDSAQVTLSINPTADDSGGEISAYELYVDTIQLTPSFTLVSSDLTMTRTLNFVAEGLTPGARHRFVVKAVNHVGASDASEELRVALGGLPGQPSAPYKVETGSSANSVMAAWAESAEVDGIDIEGYSLYMDDGYNGDLRLVYDGSEEP